ncbi:hypothetical protein JEQ12_019326 [Ovis aries]|uniref:Uncharacterized protein n=1 Tax=Ovis aries TaxID=9940 RepID=A0A836A0I3_SHEEP|nr:hypothetical protein JEQ12_019326 [Ovis aries]
MFKHQVPWCLNTDTKSFGLFEDIFQTEQEEQSHLVLHSSFKCAGENLRLMEADETTTILAPLQGKGIKKIRFLAKMRTPPPEDTAVLVRRYPLPPEWQWKDITSSSPDINLGPTLTNSWKHCQQFPPPPENRTFSKIRKDKRM